ncbi:laccase [Imleria badia]|nr:laccase [Imleria badia]
MEGRGAFTARVSPYAVSRCQRLEHPRLTTVQLTQQSLASGEPILQGEICIKVGVDSEATCKSCTTRRFGMFFYSILASSLLIVPYNALSLSKKLEFDLLALRDPSTKTNATVLGPVAQLHIANEFISPDGYNRSATVINGVYPAPLIRAKKSDHFAIEVLNELTDDSMPLETSVHFHGMFQHKSNWADGTPFVTQCPLRQQETLVQKFNATGQTGTFWYHSHYGSQACEGARGPLVIYDPEDPLKYLYDVDDENTVITLSDWYHSSTVLSQVFDFANSTLINGKGRYPGGPSTPLTVIHVKEGLRYRFRIISMSCEPSFNFTIDGHRMTIIEVDGNEVEPVQVDSIPILPGQRYSVIVQADQCADNYWIRSLSDQPIATFDGGQSMAILRYEGAPDEDPTSDSGPYELSFDESSLHPLIKPGVPGIPEIGKADVNLELIPSFTPQGHFTFGNVTWQNPTVPVLLQILSGARQASELLPNGSVYTLPPNKVIEISFPNIDLAPGGPHPVHLHGNAFHVVRVAGSNKTNFVDPVRRDVVSIGNSSADNVTIRFVTDNAGPWFLHCHIEWHLNHGFAVVMAVAPNETDYEESKAVPPDWENLCRHDQA